MIISSHPARQGPSHSRSRFTPIPVLIHVFVETRASPQLLVPLGLPDESERRSCSTWIYKLACECGRVIGLTPLLRQYWLDFRTLSRVAATGLGLNWPEGYTLQPNLCILCLEMFISRLVRRCLEMSSSFVSEFFTHPRRVPNVGRPNAVDDGRSPPNLTVSCQIGILSCAWLQRASQGQRLAGRGFAGQGRRGRLRRRRPDRLHRRRLAVGEAEAVVALVRPQRRGGSLPGVGCKRARFSSSSTSPRLLLLLLLHLFLLLLLLLPLLVCFLLLLLLVISLASSLASAFA